MYSKLCCDLTASMSTSWQWNWFNLCKHSRHLYHMATGGNLQAPDSINLPQSSFVLTCAHRSLQSHMSIWASNASSAFFASPFAPPSKGIMTLLLPPLCLPHPSLWSLHLDSGGERTARVWRCLCWRENLSNEYGTSRVWCKVGVCLLVKKTFLCLEPVHTALLVVQRVL